MPKNPKQPGTTAPSARSASSAQPEAKPGLHPDNPHKRGYDFARLVGDCPELGRFVVRNPSGEETVDFANPEAVLCLNRALLVSYYRIDWWRLPEGYLCPPIPGRADYVHHAAELLAGGAGKKPPEGPQVRLLDIGTGASCIYPLLGRQSYGWSFVAVESDGAALASAREIVRRNRELAGAIDCRRQTDTRRIFAGVVRPEERFDLSLCNPPFHASAEEAAAGTLRKLRNLGGRKISKPVLNFGGQAHELWCEGGEVGFVRRMIRESVVFKKNVRWFTTLVAKSASLPPLLDALDKAGPAERRIVEMAQGQKKSRLLAWRFD